ncbi:aspartate--tRNA ligase [uncultured Levyella sp.]|uniref:aspartate--tRNA ligase n=1 Tax=uncultured Levyella sp. TaxID=1715800 RepID=UPI0025902A3F|nr:aspartate--tRNA ligase [uncultured Levyella sp.]
MESLNGLKRTHHCGQLRLEDVGKTVTLMGWAQKVRDLGSLAFIDLRDRTGITQLTFNAETDEALYEKAKAMHQEYVLAAVGEVVERSSKNPDLLTGDIEVICSELRLLDVAKTPPIYIRDDDDVKEEMRLKYRYLDLRKPRMQEMLTKRAAITRAFREFLYQEGFIEVETPYLGKPTPEGARDYLVPSRVSPGKFYALPQSPQLYKQLLMIGGTDRYYQVARCFRDEDLRANRQPDFTQVDIEMSFVTMEDILEINERLMASVFRSVLHVELPRPFQRISFDEAMRRFGTDKPDLRYGFEIVDLEGVEKTTEFALFHQAAEAGDFIGGINFNGLADVYARKKLDKLATFAKGIGASGMLWVKKTQEGISSSFNKFLTEEAKQFLEKSLSLENGDVAVILVGPKMKTLERLGTLRTTVANENLTFAPDDFAICWIVDFPMFEYDEEEQRYVAKHHPFTKPLEEDIPLLDTDPASVRAQAYDIVINGDERGGGSIRINNADLQRKIFDLLKLSNEDIESRFGFFVEALKYGTPPHGGIAYGLDRFVMMMINRSNIRDVIAFPKTQTAQDLMMDAPTVITPVQYEELHITAREEER